MAACVVAGWLSGALVTELQFGGGAGMWRCQRPVGPVLEPVRMVALSRVMLTASAVNVAMQPWSHSVPMEIREPEARVGKMCAWQADGGRWGMLSRAVCVESMVLPSGRTTAMLGVAGRWWKLGACMVMKWPVAPVSATQLLEVYMLNGLCAE